MDLAIDYNSAQAPSAPATGAGTADFLSQTRKNIAAVRSNNANGLDSYNHKINKAQISDNVYQLFGHTQSANMAEPKHEAEDQPHGADDKPHTETQQTNARAMPARARLRIVSSQRRMQTQYAHNFLKNRRIKLNQQVRQKIWSSQLMQIKGQRMLKRFKGTEIAAHQVRSTAGVAATNPNLLQSAVRKLIIQSGGFGDTISGMLNEMKKMNQTNSQMKATGTEVPGELFNIIEREHALGAGQLSVQDESNGEDTVNLLRGDETTGLGLRPDWEMSIGDSMQQWSQKNVGEGINIFRDAIGGLGAAVGVFRQLEDPKSYGKFQNAAPRRSPLYALHAMQVANTPLTPAPDIDHPNKKPSPFDYYKADQAKRQQQEKEQKEGMNLGATDEHITSTSGGAALATLQSELGNMEALYNSVGRGE